jgi:hypothetical protein
VVVVGAGRDVVGAGVVGGEVVGAAVLGAAAVVAGAFVVLLEDNDLVLDEQAAISGTRIRPTPIYINHRRTLIPPTALLRPFPGKSLGRIYPPGSDF